MSLAKQISGHECSATPHVALLGSHALRPQVSYGDAAEANSPSSSFKVQLERGISPAARLYALRPLAHRAAMPHELLKSWKVEVKNDATVLTLGRDARIRFRHAPATFWHDLVNGNYHVVRAAWPYTPVSPLSVLVPNFIVPFVDRPYAGPLFVRTSGDTWECPIDLLASMLF